MIYISLGSILKATSLPSEKLQSILNVINKLPQRFVWKWGSEKLPGNPKNVLNSPWLPQNDILGKCLKY